MYLKDMPRALKRRRWDKNERDGFLNIQTMLGPSMVVLNNTIGVVSGNW